jgi:hypothetical protein
MAPPTTTTTSPVVAAASNPLHSAVSDMTDLTGRVEDNEILEEEDDPSFCIMIMYTILFLTRTPGTTISTKSCMPEAVSLTSPRKQILIDLLQYCKGTQQYSEANLWALMFVKATAAATALLLLLLILGAVLLAGRSNMESSLFDLKNHKPAQGETNHLRRQLTLRRRPAFTIDPKSVERKFAPLPKKPATIVTAYFHVPSKTAHTTYIAFMRNFLSLQDYMIIYTTPDLVEQLKQMRPTHLMERTTFVIMSLEETHVGNGVTYSKSFWEKQLEMDGSKAMHKSYQLFQIWASKTWFVQEAIKANPYGHEIFVWTDMGAFRDSGFNDKLYAAHTEIIPRNSMLVTSFKEEAKSTAEKNAKDSNGWITSNAQLYQIGGFQVGYADTFQTFHAAFMETFEAYVSHGLFVGEDQFILQTTCNLHYRLCSYITPDQTPQVDHWWVMKQALHVGGKFRFFVPPRIAGNAYFKGLETS